MDESPTNSPSGDDDDVSSMHHGRRRRRHRHHHRNHPKKQTRAGPEVRSSFNKPRSDDEDDDVFVPPLKMAGHELIASHEPSENGIFNPAAMISFEDEDYGLLIFHHTSSERRLQLLERYDRAIFYQETNPSRC